MQKEHDNSKETLVEIDDNVVANTVTTQSQYEQQQHSTTTGADGEKSTTPGICPCGWKHWFQGKECDFIIQPQGFNALLGFNLGDNPYILAEKYVMENDTTKTLNHRNFIKSVVDDLITVTEKFLPPQHGTPEKKESTTTTTTTTPTFDPTKAFMSVPTKNLSHFNPVTKQFERTVYAVNDEFQQKATSEEIAENVKKLKLLNEQQRKLEEEERQRNKLTANITDKVRRDRQEVELENQNRLKHYKEATGAASTGGETKAPPGSVAILRDGKIEWIDPKTSPHYPRHSPDHGGTHTLSSSNIPSASSSASPGPKTLKDLPDASPSSGHRSHHHDMHGLPVVTGAVVGAGASGPVALAVGVEEMCEHCHQVHPPIYAIRIPKLDGLDDETLNALMMRIPMEMWNEKVMIKLLKRDVHPYERTRQLMKQRGFSHDEIIEKITLASLRLSNPQQNNETKDPDDTSDYTEKQGFTIGIQTIPTTTAKVTVTATATATTTTTISTTIQPEIQPQQNKPSDSGSLITVDPSSPTTSIRVRLINSSLITITVNHHHTVQQIINHVRTLSNVTVPFKLIDTTTIPRKALLDTLLTVKQANLLNGSLQQAPL